MTVTSGHSDWLTPHEVGRLAGGFSASFVRSEIHAGQLRATYFRSRRGRLGRWRILRVDALEYIARLAASQTAISDLPEITP